MMHMQENLSNSCMMKLPIENLTPFTPEDDFCIEENYIHRCPFPHCSHSDHSNFQNKDPCQIKISIDSLTKPDCCKPNSKTLKEDSYVTRGIYQEGLNSQHRKRAVFYMLSLMKLQKEFNANIQNRLLNSILELESHVFHESNTKEQYIENLATKLFLIFQELEKRRSKQYNHQHQRSLSV